MVKWIKSFVDWVKSIFNDVPPGDPPKNPPPGHGNA